MRYDEVSGYWLDEKGGRYILNEYNPNNPIYIEVSDSTWRARHNNESCVLNWPLNFSKAVRIIIEKAIQNAMRKRSPSMLQKYGMLLRKISQYYASQGDLQIDSFLNLFRTLFIWQYLPSNLRPVFRALLADVCAVNEISDAAQIVLSMKEWDAERKLNWKAAVLQWDQHLGSLTSAEVETLRRHLAARPIEVETPIDHVTRLYLRLEFTTLRRPAQLVTLRGDALRRHRTHIGSTSELRIPLVKGQAGAPDRWEPISNDLADDIDAYRSRPQIRGTDLSTQLLLPLPRKGEGGSSMEARLPNCSRLQSMIPKWLAKENIISPTYDQPLKVGARRLRHTGGTHLAMQGHALEVIQDALQHDSPHSARFYIDAVGSSYLPVFEKVDRNLGGKFSDMKNAFFLGEIVKSDKSPRRPIIVPDMKAPAVVGACGKDGSCSVHPLFSCYSCSYFLAFREADHQRTLAHIEKEAQRWHSAERGASRSKSLKDFDRIAAGVRDVIDCIEKERGGDGEP